MTCQLQLLAPKTLAKSGSLKRKQHLLGLGEQVALLEQTAHTQSSRHPRALLTDSLREGRPTFSVASVEGRHAQAKGPIHMSGSIASAPARVTKSRLPEDPLMEFPGMDPPLDKEIEGNRMISLQSYQKTRGSHWKNRLGFSLESD